MRLAAVIAICLASAASAQAAYDAEALGYRAAQAYDAGDETLAALLWRLSAKAGSADSMTAYAGLRAEGAGVRADAADARRWYERAARRGDAQAMILLVEDIEAEDPARARALMGRAAALGHGYATHRLAPPPGGTDDAAQGGNGELK